MDDDYCQLCDRDFSSAHALDQHLRNSTIHDFDCLSCQLHFKSSSALRRHKRNSENHNICVPCNLDFHQYEGLEDHDVKEHNMCRECGRLFDSPSNRKHVRVSPLPDALPL